MQTNNSNTYNNFIKIIKIEYILCFYKIISMIPTKKTTIRYVLS